MKLNAFKILIIFLILVIFFSLPYTYASLPLIGKKIVIDVGHGGKDPGTVVGKTYEKEINLKISQYLEQELSKKGASVILIRNGDYDLSSPNVSRRKRSDFNNRIKIINESMSNLYISIHLNYLNQPKYRGPQVFYNERFSTNKNIAESLQGYLNQKLSSNREVKLIPSDTYMYDKLNIPGVLIECGFMSNSNEREQLKSFTYQKRIAKYIANGISRSI